ncbi:cobalt/nickel transport system permease protein [Desulfotomaculum arcticum]|uniref:Cobalt transport protein CbiM n=1 Tax=Desulfotruncus arcticus DSM 17038 TaxID=1121424 RepID=A0A1I2N2K5_9FIRM|nr:energy-coupling factor ABC transporter permease [Desulfotruncus arcticus]SFF98084.1 cobalt/nickel transport system permease protein [Desulfotomaculum arcticum] [Desulfotruncus arcticus DSM 17038]
MKTRKMVALTFVYILSVMLLIPQNAYAMHIMEGFLPMNWAGIWFALIIPFIFLGLRSIQKTININPSLKMLLGLAGAFAFVLSSLKIPSVTGSCSHPTGVGLGAIMFGPMTMSVLGCIILIFQAVLLAHGGITTLGANTFSMGVVGPIVSYAVFRIARKSGAPLGWSVFLAAALGDLLTYLTTSLQLALAFPDPSGGILASLIKFMGVFAVTQVPLAISEGILTVVVFNVLMNYNKQELRDLSILAKEV